MKPYVLLVSRRDKLKAAVREAFRDCGCRLRAVAEPEAGWRILASLPMPHLVVFDFAKVDGARAASIDRVRADSRLADTILLVLASSAGDLDAVQAFEHGADEFLAEPVARSELSARIRALLRRLLAPPSQACLMFHDIGLIEATRQVRVGEQPVDLTETQFKVLHLLLQKAGQILPRESIIQRLWKTAENVHTRSADMHISLLRKKLRDSKCKIEAVRPHGYRLTPP